MRACVCAYVSRGKARLPCTSDSLISIRDGVPGTTVIPTLYWTPRSTSTPTPSSAPLASASSFHRGLMAPEVRKLSGVRWGLACTCLSRLTAWAAPLNLQEAAFLRKQTMVPTSPAPSEVCAQRAPGEGCPPSPGLLLLFASPHPCQRRSVLSLQVSAQTRASDTSRVLSTAQPGWNFPKGLC